MQAIKPKTELWHGLQWSQMFPTGPVCI